MDLSAASGVAAEQPAAAERDPAAYAIGGRAPRRAFAPASRDAVAEVVRGAARDRLALVPWGAGLSLAHATPPVRYDVALDLRGVAAIVEYEPEDLTLTVECGATLAAVRVALEPHGQWLPLEAPGAGGATIGGVLAANASGARRREWGAPRDRILGARFVLGDGRPVRSGGRVVKNVAGYGSHRLVCGSRGALAVLLEASFKLLPAPHTSVALVFELPADAVEHATLWAPFAREEPTVMSVLGPEAAAALAARVTATAGGAEDRLTLVLGFEADAPWCAAQEAHATARMATLGAPRVRLEGAPARAALDALAELETLAPARATFTSAWRTPAALAALEPADRMRCVFHAPAGRLHVFPEHAGALVRRLVPHGFTLIDQAGLELTAAPASAGVRALRTRLAHAFDAGGTFAFGPEWIGMA